MALLLSVPGLTKAVALGLAACFALVWDNCGIAATLQGVCEIHAVELPLSLGLAQMLWNSLQVGIVLLTLRVLLFRHCWVRGPVGAGMLLLLLLSHYVTSPGALLLGVFGVVLVCGLVLELQAEPLNDVKVEMLPAAEALAASTEVWGCRCLRVRHDLISFLCFFCGMVYNMGDSPYVWPYVSQRCLWLSKHLLPASCTPLKVIEALYWISLSDDSSLPAQIPRPLWTFADYGNTVGEFCFVAVWAVYPCLYMGYFAGLFLNSHKSPGAAVQQFLCLFCIAHMLFLTDGVCYSYGRGLANMPQGASFHNCEKFVWRIAILLGAYQKASNRELGRISYFGWCLDLFALGFFGAFVVLQVVLSDLPLLLSVFFPSMEQFVPRFGLLGYLPSLLILTVFYGVLVVASAGQWLVIRPAAGGEEARKVS